MNDSYNIPEPTLFLDDNEGKQKFNIDDIKQVFISYSLLNLSDECKFSFINKDIDNKDIIAYFKKIADISKYELAYLFDRTNSHVHFVDPLKNRTLLDLIKKTLNKKFIPSEQMPEVGQFELWTSTQELANRENKIKSPRVFFILDSKYNIIYFLYLDLYHEIFPTKKTY